MSTSAPISADEFQALEQKVLRAVEVVKREREARVAAEAEVARLQQQIETQHAKMDQQQADHAAQLNQHTSASQAQLSALQQERAEVRQRVEKMLQQMDELL